MDLSKLTISKARNALDSKEFSALELTNAYLDAIGKKDGGIHAYLEVWENEARAEAKKADVIITEGKSQPLTGIPFAIKDNILLEGRTVMAASKILEGYCASYDATVIRKLKEAGAVFLGRANCDEFAMGGSTENSAFGPTRNPHDLERVAGGSSGGSTAAVAAALALAALGSDTGGSVREPASFCGVVGLKPTYGNVSRFGLIAMGSSLDQIGPIGKTVDDVREIFKCIRGHDSKDSTSLPENREQRIEKRKPKKIGVPRAFLKEGTDSDVLASFEATLKKLSEKDYEIREVEMPNLQYSLAVYYIIMPAEASTNLARFDGVRYGLSLAAPTVGETYAKTRGQGFGPEVRRRILVGTFVLSAGYADAYYRKAHTVRNLIRSDFVRAFTDVDAIALPTAPTPPWKFGEKADPVAMYAADIFTVPVNLAGVPAISVPSGIVEREGKRLPVGFQLIASHGREDILFSVGEDVEMARS